MSYLTAEMYDIWNFLYRSYVVVLAMPSDRTILFQAPIYPHWNATLKQVTQPDRKQSAYVSYINQHNQNTLGYWAILDYYERPKYGQI